MAHDSATQRRLRVALVFGGTIQAEETLSKPKPVILGWTDRATLPLPDGVTGADELVLLTPTGGSSYEVHLTAQMGGAVWLRGQRTEVSGLANQLVPLGPDDFGVITLGGAAIFFQMVKAAPRVGTGWPQFVSDPARPAALMLSAFVHAAILLLAFIALKHFPVDSAGDALDIDLVRQFMVTPPPELEEPEELGGTDTEDPGSTIARRLAVKRPKAKRVASAARTPSRKTPRWRARSPAAGPPSASRTSASSEPSKVVTGKPTPSPKRSRARASPISSVGSARRAP